MDAQFVLVGEDHGIAQIPAIVGALCDQLMPIGFHTMALEVGPLAAQNLESWVRDPGGRGQLATFEKHYPASIAFYNWSEEFDLLSRCAAKASGRNMPGDIAGMVSDTDFMRLAPAQQRQALAALTGDSDFHGLTDAQTAEFITRTALTRVPRPAAPIMQETDYFGNPQDKELVGLAAQGREGYASDPGVSGAMSVAGAGTALGLAGAQYGPAIAANPAVREAAKAGLKQAVKGAVTGAAGTGTYAMLKKLGIL